MKNKLDKKLLVFVGIVAIVGLWFYFQSNDNPPLGGAITDRACTVQTVNTATIGTTSSTILAAHSTRAWVRIQQPLNASSTISLAFATGTAATASSGLLLSAATTTSPVPFIEFGRNTDRPYTGDITGIVANTQGSLLVAGNASTTVHITECRYSLP